MSKNKFDDLLSKKFKNEHLEYKDHWEQFSKSLPNNTIPFEKKNKKLTIALGFAAGLALLFVSLLLLIFIKEEDAVFKHEASQIVKKEEKNQNIQTQETETADKKPTQKTNQNIEKESTYLAKKVEKRLSKPFETINDSEKREDEFIVRSDLENKNNNNINAVPPVLEVEENPESTESFVWQEEPKEYFTLPENSIHAHNAKTSISVGGGVNYGSLNTGYAVGFSAKHEIGDKLFIDGSVAMMYHNSTNNVTDVRAQTMSTSARPGMANKMSEATHVPTPNLIYLQFNPSIGYEIFEDFSVSLGTDVQQLIGNEEKGYEKFQITDNGGIKAFPTVDFGLTGKTEFKITPEIQAGFIYREGLNNFLKASPTPFVNRRYFQIQFKYNVPLK